ncbi:MAG: hypothetical protein CUN55_07235 [Phototrophicales bacterium]|nr:MAG: hypothetical protein CUN55_07235 [Phototrophicales bacterium]
MSSPYRDQYNPNQNEFSSPWVDSFQASPHHQSGNYDQPDPRTDETQRPTWDALFNIYDADPNA